MHTNPETRVVDGAVSLETLQFAEIVTERYAETGFTWPLPKLNARIAQVMSIPLMRRDDEIAALRKKNDELAAAFAAIGGRMCLDCGTPTSISDGVPSRVEDDGYFCSEACRNSLEPLCTQCREFPQSEDDAPYCTDSCRRDADNEAAADEFDRVKDSPLLGFALCGISGAVMFALTMGVLS